MQRTSFLLLALCGCSGPQGVFSLRADDAAKVAHHYDGRVTILAIQHGSAQSQKVVGALTEDLLVVTSDDEVIRAQPHDWLRVKIEYIDGDLSYKEHSRVQKSKRLGLAVLGSLVVVGGVSAFVGATASRCSPFVPTGLIDFDLCPFSLFALGFFGFVSTIGGFTLVGVGLTPRVSFAPEISAHRNGASIVVRF